MSYENQMIWSTPTEVVEGALARAAHSGALQESDDIQSWLGMSDLSEAERAKFNPVKFLVHPITHNKLIVPFVTLRNDGPLAGSMVGENRMYAVSKLIGSNQDLPLTDETKGRLRAVHLVAEDQALTSGIMSEYGRARAEALALSVVPEAHKKFYINQRTSHLIVLSEDMKQHATSHGLTRGQKKIALDELEKGIDTLKEGF